MDEPGTALMRALTTCAGFLLRVLWMDLMFDVQTLRHAADVPEPVPASIAGSRRRVTADSRPMGARFLVLQLSEARR